MLLCSQLHMLCSQSTAMLFTVQCKPVPTARTLHARLLHGHGLLGLNLRLHLLRLLHLHALHLLWLLLLLHLLLPLRLRHELVDHVGCDLLILGLQNRKAIARQHMAR
jgi:hypothetical protein